MYKIGTNAIKISLSRSFSALLTIKNHFELIRMKKRHVSNICFLHVIQISFLSCLYQTICCTKIKCNIIIFFWVVFSFHFNENIEAHQIFMVDTTLNIKIFLSSSMCLAGRPSNSLSTRHQYFFLIGIFVVRYMMIVIIIL